MPKFQELLDQSKEWLEQALGRQQDFHQDLQLSSDAKALLANPLIVRFFEQTEKELTAKWTATEPSQVEEREAAYEMLYLTRKFYEYFQQFLANEAYALHELEQLGKE